MGLQVNANGVLVRDGKPYRGIGVNCFDAFSRTLAKPDDTSYRETFRLLAERHIPFVRFAAIGYWPRDCRLYWEDKEQYFRRMDGVVKAVEQNGIGLIPSFFWHPATVSDMVGEPLDQWGNPKSKTHQFMRRYVREIVSRYRNSPAIWGWEFGNEFCLAADPPDASEHRPPVVPELGTAKSRSERDELTHDMIRTAFVEFAREVRRLDKDRILISGNSMPRPSAWHQKKEHSWTQDSEEQYAEMLTGDSPDPMNTLCVHLYGAAEKRFNRTVTPEERLRVSMAIAAKARKPLFVGEFGAGEELGHDQARKDFEQMLSALEKTRVPLAALWVFDFAGQDGTWNVTAANSRSYQLDAIAEANQRIRKGLR